MSFGYIGDTSTSVKQQVKNKGILTTQESFDLERQGFLGGSLELIHSISISSATATADFINIKEDKYNIHLLTMTAEGGADYDILLSNDNGSNFISSGYAYALQYGTSAGSFGADNNTSDSKIMFTQGSSNENGYAYFYHLGNSAKYSFINNQAYGVNGFKYGGGVYPVAQVNNAIRVDGRSGDFTKAELNLFGIKQ